jgi:hypothetical protein
LCVLGIFNIGVWELFAWGWLWTVILLFSVSWIARISGVSSQCLAIALGIFEIGSYASYLRPCSSYLGVGSSHDLPLTHLGLWVWTTTPGCSFKHSDANFFSWVGLKPQSS